ncbi:PREDICTED: uncharacterized protein LOC109189545 isoform X2 [Ipomoea nil]|uniref:uncharacterized protein LOC109189545 isoform X2 n=1 Tax=Ipomoea nil TaxID=35883 RepID=UPI000900EF3F|nr:PREDICTED: uncharacterized protein LOC109189545 isoform X2 [Ipomoea nil]
MKDIAVEASEQLNTKQSGKHAGSDCLETVRQNAELVFETSVRRITPESVMYSFGTLLLDLLSGKHFPPSHLYYTLLPMVQC